MKRKSEADWATPELKRLKLDPPIFLNLDFTTMDGNLQTVDLSDQPSVAVPAKKVITTLGGLVDVVDRLDARVEELKRQQLELNAKLEQLLEIYETNIPLYQQNILSDLIDRIFEINKPYPLGQAKRDRLSTLLFKRKPPTATTSTPELLHEAIRTELLMLQRCQDFGLRRKHFTMYLQISDEEEDYRSEYVDINRTEFARLLCSSKYVDTPMYHEWGGLYPFVYGVTVEGEAGPALEAPPFDLIELERDAISKSIRSLGRKVQSRYQA